MTLRKDVWRYRAFGEKEAGSQYARRGRQPGTRVVLYGEIWT